MWTSVMLVGLSVLNWAVFLYFNDLHDLPPYNVKAATEFYSEAFIKSL